MNKGQANIDIVFRNGLKDYEVLPPPEVWENIRPAIKTPQRSFFLIRSAALIAALVGISFLVFQLTREIPSGVDKSVLSLNKESVIPGNPAPAVRPIRIIPDQKNSVQASNEPLTENAAGKVNNYENNEITSPVALLLPESDNILTNKSLVSRRLHTATLNPLQNTDIKTFEPDFEYFPESSPDKSASRWSIAAMASPTYYSTFSSGKNDLSNQLASSEQSLISYSGGVSFSYNISKRFSVQSGLYYSSLGNVVDGINSFGGFKNYDYAKGDHNFEVLTTSGTIYTYNRDIYLIGTGPGERVLTAYTIDVFDPKKANLAYLNNTITQNFSYLELPVVLRYKVIDRTFDFNFIGGLSYNMLVNNSVYTTVDGTKYSIGRTEGVNPVSVSSSIGMGMEYNFSKKLSLNLEPTFRYYLNPFNQASGSTVHPYSFGVFSGLSYKF